MQIRIVVRGAIGLNLAPKGDYGMLVRVPVMTNLHISHLLLHSRTHGSGALGAQRKASPARVTAFGFFWNGS